MDVKKIIKAPYNYARNDIKGMMDYLLQEQTLSDAFGNLTAGMSPFALITAGHNSPKLSDISTSWMPDIDKIKLRNKQTLQNHNYGKTSEKYYKQQQASFDRLDNSIKTSTSVNANILRSSQDYHKISTQQLSSIAESSKQSAQTLKDISKTSKESNSISNKLFSLLFKIGPVLATGYTAYSFMKDKQLIWKKEDLLNPKKIVTSAFGSGELKNWYTDLANDFVINLTKKYIPSVTPALKLLKTVKNTQNVFDKLHLFLTGDLSEFKHSLSSKFNGKHYVGQFENLKDKLSAIKSGTYGQEFTMDEFIRSEEFSKLAKMYRSSSKREGKFNAEITGELNRIKRNIRTNALELNENKLFSGSTTGEEFSKLLKSSSDYDKEETINTIAEMLSRNQSTSFVAFAKKNKNIPTNQLLESWAKSNYIPITANDLRREQTNLLKSNNDKDRDKALHNIAELLSGKQSASFVYYAERHKNMSADQLLKNWAAENKIPLEKIIEDYKPSKTRLDIASVLEKVFTSKALPNIITYTKTLNNPIANMLLGFVEKQLPLTIGQKIYTQVFGKVIEHFPKMAPIVGIYQALKLRKSVGKGNLIDTGFKKFAEAAELDKRIEENAKSLMDAEIAEKNLTGKENSKEYKDIVDKYETMKENVHGTVAKAPKNLQKIMKSTLSQRLIDNMAKTNLAGALALQVVTGHSMRAIKTFLSTTKTFGPIVRGIQNTMDFFKGVYAAGRGVLGGVHDFWKNQIKPGWKNVTQEKSFLGKVKAIGKFALTSFKKIIFGGLIKSMFKGAIRSLIKVFTGVTWPVPGLDDTQNLLAASLIGQNTLTSVTGELIGKTITVEESIFATLKKFFHDIYDDTFGAVRVIFSKGDKKDSDDWKYHEDYKKNNDNNNNNNNNGSSGGGNGGETNWRYYEDNRKNNGNESNFRMYNSENIKVNPKSVKGNVTITDSTAKIAVNLSIGPRSIIIMAKGIEEIAKQIINITKQKGISILKNDILAKALNTLPVGEKVTGEIARRVINFVTKMSSKVKMFFSSVISKSDNDLKEGSGNVLFREFFDLKSPEEVEEMKQMFKNTTSNVFKLAKEKTGNFIKHPIKSAKGIVNSGINFAKHPIESLEKIIDSGIIAFPTHPVGSIEDILANRGIVNFAKHPVGSTEGITNSGINFVKHPVKSVKNMFKSTNLFSVFKKKVPGIALPEGNKVTQDNLLAMIAATELTENKSDKSSKNILSMLKSTFGTFFKWLVPIILGLGAAIKASEWLAQKGYETFSWIGHGVQELLEKLGLPKKVSKTISSPGFEGGLLLTGLGVNPGILDKKFSGLGHHPTNNKNKLAPSTHGNILSQIWDVDSSIFKAIHNYVMPEAKADTISSIYKKHLKTNKQIIPLLTKTPLTHNISDYDNTSKVSNQDLSKVNDVGTVMYKSMKQSIIDAYIEMGIYNPSATKSNGRVYPTVNNIPRAKSDVSSEIYNIISGSYPSVA